MEIEMEKEKNTILMEIYYMMVIIKMENGMEKEKDILKTVK